LGKIVNLKSTELINLYFSLKEIIHFIAFAILDLFFTERIAMHSGIGFTVNICLYSQRHREDNEKKKRCGLLWSESKEEVREGIRSKLSLRLCPPVIPSAIRGQKAILYSSSAQCLLLRQGKASTSLL